MTKRFGSLTRLQTPHSRPVCTNKLGLYESFDFHSHLSSSARVQSLLRISPVKVTETLTLQEDLGGAPIPKENTRPLLRSLGENSKPTPLNIIDYSLKPTAASFNYKCCYINKKETHANHTAGKQFLIILNINKFIFRNDPHLPESML